MAEEALCELFTVKCVLFFDYIQNRRELNLNDIQVLVENNNREIRQPVVSSACLIVMCPVQLIRS